MKTVQRWLVLCVGWILATTTLAAAPLAAKSVSSKPESVAPKAATPQQVITNSYQSLRQLIDTQQLVAGMPEEQLFALMERELDPVVDFPRVARKVMGKFARRASDEQHRRFTQLFKKTLVSTYSKGLNHLDQLERAEIGAPVYSDQRDLAKVPMTIILKDGTQYAVVYSMFTDSSGVWLVENIVVEGVNIGLVMRNQFAHYMDQYNDVEAAITHWGS